MCLLKSKPQAGEGLVSQAWAVEASPECRRAYRTARSLRLRLGQGLLLGVHSFLLGFACQLAALGLAVMSGAQSLYSGLLGLAGMFPHVQHTQLLPTY